MVFKNPSHFLSLIIPVYRGEKTIVDNVKRVKQVLDTVRYDYEIIVVLDGKIDNAFSVLKKAKIPKTVVIFYPQNHGKSFAIRVGMKEAKGDYVMFLDSGMEIDPNGISMLLEHMEWYDADIIVGSKRHPVSQVNYALSRWILSNGYCFIVKMLFGIKIKDTQAGIKIFKKKVIEKILPRLVEKKFAGDLEILVASKELGFTRIFEAPIKMDYQLSKLSSAATWKSITDILIDTIAIWYRKTILRYYSRKNLPLHTNKVIDMKIYGR
jgi:glycosyltransferase involved in cell wall biosynthesis